MAVVAVFTALHEEKEILAGRLGLAGLPQSHVWTGQLGSTTIYLYGPDQIGRVPAAIETLKFFHEHGKPDFLMVVGIAGGMQITGVGLGDIIIASTITDIACRKIREDQGKMIDDFRPKTYRGDDRIKKYLCSPCFNLEKWQSEVTKTAGWPAGHCPQILYGTLASSDAVVASQEWVTAIGSHLCELWPDLLGMEMEAGGVCAVAEEFDLPVGVVRCISDYANPAKSDNEWRRRAMDTVAHLLKSLDFDAMMGVIDQEREENPG
jgi:nucleoside phosphorylase